MKPRRTCLMFVCAIPLLMPTAFAQKPLSVMDWKTEYTVNTYLLQEMHRQYDSRRTTLTEALRSRDATLAYVHECRTRFLRLLGPPPPHSPLNAAVVGVIPGTGYSIERIVYESFDAHHVTGNLYLPKGKGPFPAALLFCGHEDAAKATVSYQHTAILFATHGFVVLVVDPISQGERHQLTDAAGKPLTRGGTTEHTLLNAGSNLVGTSTAAYELWDNVRGLDYLVTRSEVDTSRIGCLGNSGGGIQTVYFSAFERRVKVAAVCSYLSSRERTLDPSGPADGCAQIPDEGKLGMEMCDYLIAAAPNPVLVLAGRFDFIDYRGTREAVADLEHVYSVLGESRKVSLFTYDDGHGLSMPKREVAVAWFRRWLCNDPSPVIESPVQTCTAPELFCTPTGQINAFYKDEVTVAQRNAAVFDSLAQSRRVFLQKGRAEILDTVRSLLSMKKNGEGLTVESCGPVVNAGIRWERIIVRRSGEIPLPILIAYPPAVPKRISLWLHQEGKGVVADSITMVRGLLAEGCAVILCDVRGTGETTDKPDLNDPKYYNAEYRNAMLALHIGRSLVGQRTSDVLNLFEYIGTIPSLSHLPLDIDASGIATLPALLASVLSERVAAATLHGGMRSFKDVLARQTEKNWYSYVIPRVARFFDIPDLAPLAPALRVDSGK
jgi:dienelactone hydrolase